MVRIFFLLLSFMAVVTFTSSAQVVQPARFEAVIPDGIDFEVASAGEEGLLLFREIKSEYKTTDRLWEIIKLDTTLNTVWRVEHLLSPELRLESHYVDNGILHLLFRSGDQKQRNFEMRSVSVTSGEISSGTIKNFIPFAVHDFKVMDRSILLSGYFNYRPFIILYHLEEGVPRVLPGIFSERSEIVEVKVNPNDTFDVILKGKTIDNAVTLFISTFDIYGNLIKKIILDTDKSKGLLFGRSQPLDGYSQLIAGVYGRRFSEYSRGVFVANINDYGEQKIKFYNYGELKNFFRYMKAKREQRVLKRIERKKIKNKKLRFNYRLLVHELIKDGDQYILVGEAFYPKYKTSSNRSAGLFNTVWSANTRSYHSNLVFDGYRYTHAVVLGFDEKGNLLWDNSFETKGIISFELEQFVQVHTTEDKTALFYVYDNSIRSKIIRGNEVLEGKEKDDIRLAYEGDKASENATDIGGLRKWYDNVFFTYGVQEIKNQSNADVPLSRKVFFVNKVVFAD